MADDGVPPSLVVLESVFRRTAAIVTRLEQAVDARLPPRAPMSPSRGVRSAADAPRPRGGASAQAVAALRKAGAGETKETACAVCQEDFAAGDELRVTPCSHAFHGPCIAEWLRRSHRCPICRFELPAKKEDKHGARAGAASGS